MICKAAWESFGVPSAFGIEEGQGGELADEADGDNLAG